MWEPHQPAVKPTLLEPDKLRHTAASEDFSPNFRLPDKGWCCGALISTRDLDEAAAARSSTTSSRCCCFGLKVGFGARIDAVTVGLMLGSTPSTWCSAKLFQLEERFRDLNMIGTISCAGAIM